MGSTQEEVTQVPLPFAGHSMTLYVVKGPPDAGGVMEDVTVVGPVGLIEATVGCGMAGVVTGTAADAGVALPLASMATT